MQRLIAIAIGFPAFLSVAAAQQQPTPVEAPLCAAATQAGCQCAVLLPSSLGSGIAQLTSIEGTVLVSRGAGFSSATPNSALTTADRIVTGEGSGANVQVARSCDLSVPAQSIVTFSEVEGCSCAMITSNEGEVGAQGEPPPPPSGGGGVVAGAFVGSIIPGAVAAGTELSEDDEEHDE
jgi:hypothetical protein